MNASDYQRLAMRTHGTTDPTACLNNAALGLTGEAGEFADHVKKHLFHGHIIDVKLARKELGDVAWYLAQACTALELDLSEVMSENIDKLRTRYPNNFNTADSLARVDVQMD